MKCSNPDCANPDIVESDQGLICATCGTIAQEESGLVSEQGFGETDSGRITALGVHVGESQTHQRTYAPGGALGNAGREPTINRDRSEAHARTIMLSYQPLLGVRPSEVEAGMQIFKLAWSNSFVQGRTIDSVAVVCLYLACRRKHEQIRNERRPMYSLMLIDFAEKLNIDVFALGRMYTDLVRKLYLQPDGSIQGDVSADLLAMGPEVLVSRFVDELEFDKLHRDKIKLDAIRIVQRMKRDWMSTGRRPSGVCGAAVILAARMNNYRRTTREVVLTAKVTEITINKRLEEFHDTESSKLSIAQFRNNDVLDALVASDPPAYQRGLNPKVKRKRGRPRKHPLAETAAEIEGDTTTPEPHPTQESQDGQPPPAKRIRIDADGYKIPDIPPRQNSAPPSPDTEGAPSNASDESSHTQPTSQRRKRAANWKAPPASPAELAIETEIENDIAEALRENPDLDPTHQTTRVPQSSASASASSNQQPSLADITPLPPFGKDKTPGPPVNTSIGNTNCISLSPTLRPDEFDLDEDVSQCLLSSEESLIKERVWVSTNADWIRQDHAKRIKRELKEAEMRARGLDPVKEAMRAERMKGKRKDGTKRPGRRGDVSYLREGDGAGKDAGDGETEGAVGRTGHAAQGTAADRERSAAESVRKMFKTRGVYSRRVNYDVLESIYGVTSGDSADSRSVTAGSQSQDRSRSGSVMSVVDGEDGREREGSATSSIAASGTQGATVSGGIFRGNGGRDSGRLRSRASLAAEKRERKRREKLDAQKAAVGGKDDSAERSVSRSRSASTPAASGDEGEDEGEGETTTQRRRESSRPSPDLQFGPRSRQQLPSPPQTQSQGISTISTSAPRSTVIPNSNPLSSSQLQQLLPDLSGREGQVAEKEDDEGDDGEEDESNDDDDDEDLDEDEDEEDDYPDDYDTLNPDIDAEGEGDLDAAFEGRYTAREW